MDRLNNDEIGHNYNQEVNTGNKQKELQIQD